jgi:hypothetical protein
MCVVNLRILYSQRHKENAMPFRLAIVAGLLLLLLLLLLYTARQTNPITGQVRSGQVGAEAEVQAKRKSLNKTFSFPENVPLDKRYDSAAHMLVHGTVNFTIIEYTSKIKKSIYYNFFNRIPSDMTFLTHLYTCVLPVLQQHCNNVQSMFPALEEHFFNCSINNENNSYVLIKRILAALGTH